MFIVFYVNYVFYKEEIYVILKKCYDKIIDIFWCDWYMYFLCLRFKKYCCKKVFVIELFFVSVLNVDSDLFLFFIDWDGRYDRE